MPRACTSSSRTCWTSRASNRASSGWQSRTSISEPVFSHVLGLFRERADKKQIRLEQHVPGDLPLARADRRALENILTNLVDNAVKYCGSGAEVRLSASDDADAGVVRVVAEDTGPGIEARHLSRLFERFYRVDAGRSRQLGGTGLGLSIVKHLVEAMGGSVGVDSEPGRGTRFRFSLPRAEQAKAPVPK